jgi:hypothetical protein
VNMFDNFYGHPLMEALGWALVHFIWQGALIAILLATIMSFIRRGIEGEFQGDQLEGSFSAYLNNSTEIFEKATWKATRSTAPKTGK